MKKLAAVALAGIIILSGILLLVPRKEPQPGGELPFTLSYDSIKSEPTESFLVRIDPEQEWQYSAALCYVPVTSRSSKGEDGVPLFFSTGGGIAASGEKYGPFKETSVSSLGGNECEASIYVATEHWSDIEVAVVASDYEEGILLAPVASYLNAPLLFDGEHLVPYLIERRIENIIVFGEEIYPGFGVEHLYSQEDVWSFYLSILKENCEYIVVCNPDDITGKEFYVPSLSLLSPVIASERRALIITGNYTIDKNLTFALGYGTGDAGSGERGEDEDTLTDEQEIEIQRRMNEKAIRIDNDIDNVTTFLNDSGQNPRFLSLVGCQGAVPMLYLKSPVWYENVNQEEKGEEYVATDSFYGDLDIILDTSNDTFEENYHYQEDDLLYKFELAVGRIIAPNIEDASTLVARSLYYWRYEFTGEEGLTPEEQWWRRAMIVNSLMCGDSDNFAADHQQAVFAENEMVAEVYEPRQIIRTTYFPEREVTQQMEKVNALIYDGHGYPDGWYHTWASTHDNDADFDRIGFEDVGILDMHAVPVFGACCLSSALDWPIVWATSDNRQDMTPEKIIALAFIRAGALCYIGATEESWGTFFGGLADGNPDAWGYGDFDMPTMFWEYLLGDDVTIGEALNSAKTKFFELIWTSSSGRPFARLCILETVLYGEPAVLPFHPGIGS